jgi:hypothetical protein
LNIAHAIADDLLQQQLLVKLIGALDHGGKVVMKLILILLTLAAAAAGAVGGGGGDHRQQPVLRVELFRRDHPLSPLVDSTTSRPNLTMSEKFLEAVKRSNRRRDAIVRSIHEAAAGRRAAAAAANDDAGADVSSSSAYYNIPVAAGDGEYLTQIAMGTPTQVVTAIVDTGSDLMWTQCLPCTSCYAQSSPVFNPATSSTYQVVNCGNNLCRVRMSMNLLQL